jgi:MFS family permease
MGPVPNVGTVPVFWRVTLPFLAGYFISYLYRSVNALIGPEIARELGLGSAGLGLLTAVFFFAFPVFQVPLGILLDRYGPRRVNGTMLLVAAAGGSWFALGESAAELTAARGLIGLGVSGCLMAAFSAFVLWYPPERIATMNGVAFASGMLGAIAATVPLEMLLRVLHWRDVFAGIVAINIAVSVLLFFAVPERTVVRRGESLRAQLSGLTRVAADPAFWRLALCIGASQVATVSLQTLWVATWLRDLMGYGPAQVARALLLFAGAMMLGFIGFGRASDALVRRGRSTLPLLAGGVAIASLCLGLLALGVRTGALALWAVFFCCATAVTLAFSLFSRRYPREMAGRVNTALNVFVFVGMFSGQWAVGWVLSFWPQTAGGYAPAAYSWALAMLWAVQFAGLAWLWAGRGLLVPRT